jgi:phosphate-selective porin OprO/OprP
MNRERGLLIGRITVATMALLIPITSFAQRLEVRVEPSSRDASGGRELVKAGGGSDEIDQLKAKVDMLLELVEKQQRALASLEKRLSEVEREPSASRNEKAVQNDQTAPSVARSAAADGATPANAARHSEGAQEAKSDPSIVAGWNGSHAFLKSRDGSFETTIGGFGHFDFRGYSSGQHPPNTFLTRRARIALEGTLARYYEFKVEGDFADTSSTLLRDFYLNIHRTDEFQLKFGHFKEPFSQEELRSDPVQDFVERSMVNNLAPSRSPGFMAFGSLKDGVVEYQAGVFNAKGALSPNNNGTPETVARLRFNPFKRTGGVWTKGLIFGGAVAQGRSDNGLGVTGVTESRSFVFYQPVQVNGKVNRSNGELTWLVGPAALRAEYVQVSHEREGLGLNGGKLPGEVAKGLSAQFTYLLTGESKGDVAPVSPTHDLFSTDAGRAGFGAIELKARFARLQISDGSSRANHAESFYFGANWYMNRFVRYVQDLGLERFGDPFRSPNPINRTFFVVLSRIQVVF